MTALPPAGHLRDAVVDRLIDLSYRGRQMTGPEARAYADILLPLLEEHVARALTEARADELEQAVQRAHRRNNGMLFGTASLIAADLATRADTLRASIRQTDERNDR